MSTEQGIITKISKNIAWVKVRRSSMCDACRCHSACHSITGDENMVAEAINTAKASIGDHVLLNLPTKALWKASFIVYIIPVIFLMAGVILGMKWAGHFSLEPETGAFICGITGCFFSFLIIRFLSKIIRNNKDYIPEVIKIL